MVFHFFSGMTLEIEAAGAGVAVRPL